SWKDFGVCAGSSALRLYLRNRRAPGPNKPAQYLHRRPRTGSFELRSCLLILAGFQKNHAEIQPRRGVTGIHLYSLFALLDGEIVMPRLVGDPPYNRIDNHGQGVEFLGALDLRQRFRMAGRGPEIDAIEVMSCCAVRIELDGAAEFLSRAIPVPVVKEGRIR